MLKSHKKMNRQAEYIMLEFYVNHITELID